MDQKNLWLIVLVVLVIFLVFFIGNGKKIEGYEAPLDVDHIGAYHMIGSVGGGPRFQLPNGYGGSGEYIMQEGASGYTGVYGDSRNAPGWIESGGADRDCLRGGGPPSYSNQRTPGTWSWSGRYNVPRCGGCGYSSCMCCEHDGRGCPNRYAEYSYFPMRRALPP